MKIFQRFFIFCFALVLLTTIFSYLVQDWFFRVQQDREVQEIDYHLRNVRLYIVNFDFPISKFLERNNLELNIYTVDEENRSVKYSVQGIVGNDINLSKEIVSYEDAVAKCSAVDKASEKVLRENIKRSNGDYVLQTFCDNNNVYILVSPFTQYQKVIKILQRSFVITLIATIIIATILSYIQAQYFSKRIQVMNDATKELSNSVFDKPIEIESNDELGELANNINLLAAKLQFTIRKLQETITYEQSAKEKQSQMFASMSHELKTPITILKGTLEGIKDQIGPYKNPLNYTDDMIEEVDNMENIVLNLLNYARFSSNTQSLNFTKISLRRLLVKEINRLDYLLEEKDIDLETKLIDNEVVVDIPSIKIVIKNILENAIFYSSYGAKIEILATSFSNHVLIQVINYGTNIKEDSTNVIFEPFYREEESRLKYKNGTGLGLTIVKQILEQHNSTFSLYNINDDDEYAVCFEFTLSTIDTKKDSN